MITMQPTGNPRLSTLRWPFPPMIRTCIHPTKTRTRTRAKTKTRTRGGTISPLQGAILCVHATAASSTLARRARATIEQHRSLALHGLVAENQVLAACHSTLKGQAPDRDVLVMSVAKAY